MTVWAASCAVRAFTLPRRLLTGACDPVLGTVPDSPQAPEPDLVQQHTLEPVLSTVNLLEPEPEVPTSTAAIQRNAKPAAIQRNAKPAAIQRNATPAAGTAMGRKHTALNPAAASSSSSKNGHSRVSQQGHLSRTPSSVRSSSFKRDHAHKNVKWSEADEAKLTRLVQEHPDATWHRIAELMVMGSRSAPRTAQAVAQKHIRLTQVQRAQMAVAAAAAARPMPSSSSSSKVNLRWMWDVGLRLR